MRHLFFILFLFMVPTFTWADGGDDKDQKTVEIPIVMDTELNGPRDLTIPVEAWLMGDNISVIALSGISVITLTITDEMGNLVDSCITSLFAGQSAVLSVAGCPTGNYRITIQLPDDTVLYGEFIL